MLIIEDKVFNAPTIDGDCEQVWGDKDDKIFRRCIFDLRSIETKDQDELVDVIKGGHASFTGCVFLGGIKALLIGNGDHPIEDYGNAHVLLEDCAIIGCGRRCPEVQHGARADMRRVWVHNWGDRFDVRAFGAWAHSGSVICAQHCLFTRSKGLGVVNAIKDLANHIGEAVNEYGLTALLSPRTYLSGTVRGLTADTGGIAIGTGCWRNSNSIRVDGCDTFLDDDEVVKIVSMIEKSCPDMTPYLGSTLLHYFMTEIYERGER